MLFKWEIQSSVAWAPIQTSRIGSSHHMEYFLLFFWKHLRSDTDEKVDLGNNERPIVYIYMLTNFDHCK